MNRSSFAPIALAACFFLPACSGDEAPARTDAAAEEVLAEGSEPAPPREAPRPVVRIADELDASFDALYSEWLATQVAPSALRYVLLEDEPPIRIRRRDFLAALYNGREFAPIFFAPGAGMSRVDAVVDELARAPEHSLDVHRYLTEEVLRRVRDAREWRAATAHRPRPMPTREESLLLREIAEGATAETREEAMDAFFHAVMDSTEPGLARLRAFHAEVIDVERVAQGAAALAEIALMDTTLNYAFDQRHFNTSMLNDASEEEQHRTIAERMRGTWQALADAADADAVRAVLQGLPPTHPQYPLLLRERARYADIVASGGWEELRPTSLRRGSRGARVAELKRRLQIEGFYTGEIDESFDSALEQAVRAYQETHQMEVTGESSRDFWSSLNISAADRLAQIELTMQRWRESRIGDDSYYIFVNIPDFHTEVWRDGVRQTRFRIVVGNTQRVCDQRTGQWRMPNATPIQSARMSYVVLNPYWNIPSRILEEELLPALVNREDYFERQGIELVDVNGTTRVRQRPGPQNPLGRVKFMFPNVHDTYLHDTSRPQYFQYPIRAFSHGCMRVQNPLDFLQLLLENDGQWDPQRVQRIFDSSQETSITLRNAVPVHIEYYVVRVDDEGRANFAADIYRYDRERLNPSSSDQLRCTPAARPDQRLVLGADGRPMVRDASGNLVPVQNAQEGSSDPAAGDFGP